MPNAAHNSCASHRNSRLSSFVHQKRAQNKSWLTLHKMQLKRSRMARPKLYKNRARLTLNLEKSVLREFDRLAFNLNKSRSQVLSLWVRQAVEGK